MKRILVTGGFGFLGSHLVQQLLEDSENRIFVVDDLSSSPLPLPTVLDELPSRNGNLDYATEDLKAFCHEWQGPKFDEIYHLASVVGPAGLLPHTGRIAVAIIEDAAKLVEFARQQGARLVYVSSSEVYGGGREGFCTETMPKILSAEPSPRLEYAAGKAAAEISVLNSCSAGRLDACVVRPFNISGPRQSGKGGFVLPRFIGQAIAGAPITVFGDGTQVRAFTYVVEMSLAIARAMRRGRGGEVYNLGNGDNRCSILELAQEVIAVTGSSSAITFVDPRTIYGPLYHEANDKFPDSTKALEHLDWKPEVRRRQIIEETFNYMRSLPPSLLEHLRGF